jgi:RNA polymerase sigma factor (TIGR02999 family)
MADQRPEGPEDEAGKLLDDLRSGREGAEEELLPLLYDELRSLARRQMRRERPGHTLQATALVHEAYMRLSGAKEAAWEDKTHFLRVAARAMRRILVDHARGKRSDKSGGNRERLPLDSVAEILEEASDDLVFVDELLERLAAVDARTAQVVELRFFAGLTLDETARTLGVSRGTVKNDWTFARAWLKKQMP